MAKKNRNQKKKDGSKEDSGFDLLAPAGHLGPTLGPQDLQTSQNPISQAPRPKAKADASLKQLTWKGFEEPVEEGSEDPPMDFKKRLDSGEDGMDMTPMVDVTFLLLIFFMVTASFSVQRSIEQPPPQVNEPSTNVVEDEEQEKDYVEVIIDQNNNFLVTTRTEEEVETPSEALMRAKVRNAVKDYGAERLLITAHVDSFHERVVTVWDAGFAANIKIIQIRTTETEY
jgi:biopolymer transport protein ExbD